MARSQEEVIINAFRIKLKEALGEGFEVEIHKEVSAAFGYVKEVFDLVVFYHDDVICGIDCKNKLFISSYVYRFQESWIFRLNKVGLRYGIIYYGDDHNLYFWAKGDYTLKEFSLEDAVIAIKGNQKCGNRLTSSDIMEDFLKFIPPTLDSKRNSIYELFSDDDFEYDENSSSMCLKTQAEDKLFQLLLNNNEKDNDYRHVCRYTTLNSLFLTMKEHNHVMCSITCMNDKGETSYADKYVSYGAFANPLNIVKENNDCFILSFCNEEMVDNLTMWRLYGNDGNGVCLEYDVDSLKIDNKEFFFAPVSYGNKQKKHPVLDFIRDLRHWEKNGWHFEFKRWYIWKHFFKSHLFKEENEVRLLFIWTDKSKESVEWIIDSANNIASRICKFPVDNKSFPLTLTNAIIGPKCPNQECNVAQFNYMNSQQKTMKDSPLKSAVEASKIEDYR